MIEHRIENLLKQMSLAEKISLCHADSKFTTAGIERLGIPRLAMSDGPHGVRQEIAPDSWAPAGWTDDYVTYLPTACALAATWNRDMARRFGDVLGAEARHRGKDIILGPGVNIVRTPVCGRNFEYFGEDPFHVGQMAAEVVRGIQRNDVAACVKHYALNNQEWNRGSVDVIVDERALREIYLPAFERTVRAGAWSVMAAYNKVRGQWCTENEYLVRHILKGEWAFDGVYLSDWGAVHSTDGAARYGLDIEMGTHDTDFEGFHLARAFREAVERGAIAEAVLDDKVRRILRVMIRTGMLDPERRRTGARNVPRHQQTARDIAAEAIVLLKNDGVLPLDMHSVRKIAVIGANATARHAEGGGSSEVKALYEITPLEGLRRKVGRMVEIVHVEGWRDTGHEADQPADDPESEFADALGAARAADAVLVFGGLSHKYDQEDVDRRDIRLPGRQNELIGALVAANPRTAVFLIGGGPVEMPWIDRAPCVVQAWYAGMEGGSAMADIVFGDVNPSGRLPVTFPRRLEDSPAHAIGQYSDVQCEYREGLLVGYRYHDTKEVEPLFPFGHGLSYTTFTYGNLTVDPRTLEIGVDITNDGDREGQEVVQLYVHDAASRLPRPVKELKGFEKVTVAPGETVRARFRLTDRDLSYYDDQAGRWVLEPGEFEVRAGRSAGDIRLVQRFHYGGPPPVR